MKVIIKAYYMVFPSEPGIPKAIISGKEMSKNDIFAECIYCFKCLLYESQSFVIKKSANFQSLN